MHPDRKRTLGECVGVHAPWSKGKTLLLTFIAKERSEAEGLDVLANFYLKGIKSFRFLDDIELIKEVRRTVIEIDEIRRYADSYLSKGMKARFVSNLLADTGKQSCALYYSDQKATAAPVRLRDNLSFVLQPEFDEDSEWCTVYYYDSLMNYDWGNPSFYFGFYAPDYWNYFDTRQKIEDYKMKFHTDRYVDRFLNWVSDKDYPINKKILNMWNVEEGEELCASEISAVITKLELKGKVEKKAKGKE